MAADDISIGGENYMPIHQKILKYKASINSLKAKMEGYYNLVKIETLENELKSKKDLLYNLKYENNVLNNIQKNQNKAKVQFEEKYDNKNEIKQLQEKLKTIKAEFKYSKDLQKSTEAKLKTQNNLIFQMEEKNSKIKFVIELKKRNNTGNSNQIDEQIRSEVTDINYLEEKVKFNEIQVASEEKNYKIETSKQQFVISKYNEELSLINIQLKEREQEIRINELKLKELKKVKRHTSEVNNINSKFMIETKQNSKNHIKNSTNNRASSAQLKDNNVYSVNAKSKSKPRNSQTNKVLNNKPFNIKFENKLHTEYFELKNNNNNLNILPLVSDRKNTKTVLEKDDMLNQIENIKNDLKNTLKYNDDILRGKGLENDNFLNDNHLFDNQYPYKDQSSLISNKDLFEKMDQSIIHPVKESKEITNNYYDDKRKPFKQFTFAMNRLKEN